MSSRIKCFFLTPIDLQRQALRRYVSGDHDCSHNKLGYHNAEVQIEDARPLYGRSERDSHKYIEPVPVSDYADDPRWPTRCACGYEFQATDQWQIFTNLYYLDDNGNRYTLRDAPVGAMWDAWWYPRKGPDGIALMVRTPGGDWFFDGQASNCTEKEDDVHRCWVRHGTPPEITVDKNGHTCGAGAGSIAQKNYHGFLRNGYLEAC